MWYFLVCSLFPGPSATRVAKFDEFGGERRTSHMGLAAVLPNDARGHIQFIRYLVGRLQLLNFDHAKFGDAWCYLARSTANAISCRPVLVQNAHGVMNRTSLYESCS